MGSAIPYVVGGEGLAHRWRTLGAGFLRFCCMGWRVSRKGLAQGVGASDFRPMNLVSHEKGEHSS